MKLVKRITITLLISFILLFIFKGCLYRKLVTYKSIGNRESYDATNKELISYIESHTNNTDTLSINEIIQLSLKITSKHLNFTSNTNENNPNNLIESKTAHCVGYASFFATTCNFLFKKFNYSQKWKAETKIGQLYIFNNNVHKYINTPFFKDHDFVIIKNNITNEIIATDPTLHDYLLIDIVTFKK